MRNMESVISSQNNEKKSIPVKDILDATPGFEMNDLWIIKVPHPRLCLKQRSLMKPKTNVKDIAVLLNDHSKKDSGTILEKSMKSALNFQSIFEL